jgi:hypothetical protein
MSLFNWLFSAKKPAKALAESSGLSRMEPTRPTPRRSASAGGEHGNNAQPANRKGERMARRELLYTVVRESMMRAGVLSASYKFKVLSLDGRGRQFLVMVDLARDHGAETSRLAEIEALIAQGAKSRHDIIVTAVYWRLNDHVAVGDPRALPQHAVAQLDSQPAPLDSSPAPLTSSPMPLHANAAPASRSRYDPIQADEVAAFKAALAAGASNPAGAAAAAVGVQHGHGHGHGPGASARTFDGSNRHGPQSYTLLTGFEDTELPDSRAPALSGTQYGDLN